MTACCRWFISRAMSTKAPAASAAQPASAQAAWQIQMAPRAPERELNLGQPHVVCIFLGGVLNFVVCANILTLQQRLPPTLRRTPPARTLQLIPHPPPDIKFLAVISTLCPTRPCTLRQNYLAAAPHTLMPVIRSSPYGHLARTGGSPGSRERSMAYNVDSSYSQSALRSERVTQPASCSHPFVSLIPPLFQPQPPPPAPPLIRPRAALTPCLQANNYGGPLGSPSYSRQVPH